MIYLTGSNGLVGSRFLEFFNEKVITISYRDDVVDVFETHESSCLIHLAWSSTTRDTYDEFERVFRKDVTNSKILFDYYLAKNPNGKIIFVSSAGDLHLGLNTTASEEIEPSPNSLYGYCKLQVENLLSEMNCKTIVLRTSNIWGGNVSIKKVNGLFDKLLKAINTDQVVEIFADLKTEIDLIHIDDFVELLIKVVRVDLEKRHELFLVGGQSFSICDVIDIISKKGCLNLKINNSEFKKKLHIDSSKARKVFEWEPKKTLK